MKSLRRYVVASRDLEAGTLLRKEDFDLKRITASVEAIEPKYMHKLIGKRINVHIKKGGAITVDIFR